jgi:hypothetical protein
MGDGGSVDRGEDVSIEHKARPDRKEPTMDTRISFQHVKAHQQQLRDEAAAYRLARSGQHPFRPSNSATRIPRTIGALRQLVGSIA